MKGAQVHIGHDSGSQDSSLSLLGPLATKLRAWPLLLSLILHVDIQEVERYFKTTISALRNFIKLNFYDGTTALDQECPKQIGTFGCPAF